MTLGPSHESTTEVPTKPLPANVTLSGDLVSCLWCGKSHRLSRRGNREAELQAFVEIHSDCRRPG